MQKFTKVLALVNIILIVLVVFLGIQLYSLRSSSDSGGIDTGTEFTDQELLTFMNIKNRVAVMNTDPNFTGNRILEWISMRNSTSAAWDNYNQKSMEYLCFWTGQGVKGEWEAVVSIYNVPNSTTDYVVEVSRFTWHSLQVTLDGNIMASFPQIAKDTTSLGYATFHVEI